MEIDNKQHEDFASLSSVSYIRGDDLLKDISSYFEQAHKVPAPPLVILGKSGSGKSALVAHYLRSKEVPANSFVFLHSATLCSATQDPGRALRRLIASLQKEFGWDSDHLPTELEELSLLLPDLIANVAAMKPVYIVLDGFDSLMAGNTSGFLKWLPVSFPTNTRVILTSSPTGAIEKLIKKHCWEKFEMTPLSLPEKAKLIGRILSDKGKTLSKEQLRLVLTSTVTEDPLFLSICTTDICSIPQEQIDSILERHLMCEDFTSLFLSIIKRLEEYNSPQIVEGILRRIALSRHGFSQRELLGILQMEKICNATEFEKVWGNMKHLFNSYCGLYVCAHEQIQFVIEKIFLGQTKTSETCARKIANFFEKLLELQKVNGHIDDRIIQEFPYAIYKSGDNLWLKDLLLDYQFFLKISGKERRYELLTFWKFLGTPTEMAEEYSEMLLSLGSEEDRPSDEQLLTLFDKIAEVSLDAKAFQYALFICEKGVEFKQKYFPNGSQEIAIGYQLQGIVYQKMGKYEKAIEFYKESLSYFDQVPSLNNKILIETITNLATCFENTRQYEAIIPLYARSAAIQKKAYGPQDPSVAGSLYNLANIHKTLEQYDKAEVLYKHAMTIQEHAFGSEHPRLAILMTNFGLLYQSTGQFDKALPMFQRSITIREKWFGHDHPDVATSIQTLAKLYEAMAQYEHATLLYQQVLKIREQCYGPEHPEIASTFNSIGSLYYLDGKNEQALSFYNKALDIRMRIFGSDHPSVANTLNNLAVLHEKMQEDERALILHTKALKIQESKLGQNHPDIATTLNNQAVIYEKLGQFEKAAELYGKVLAIREHVNGVDHIDVAVTLNNQATLIKKMNQPEKALELYNRAIDIVMKIYGPGHPLAKTISKNKTDLINEVPVLEETPSELSKIPTRTFLSGDLYKLRGKIRDKWQKRLFFLNKTRLEWYANNETTPRKFIQFESILEVRPVEESKFKRKFVFEIKTPSKCYVLQAENQESYDEWVENINKCIQK